MILQNAYPEHPSDLMYFAGKILEYVLWAVLLVTLVVVATLGIANAQEMLAPATSTVVDFGPLAGIALEIVAPVVLTALGGLATWVLTRIGKSTGLTIDARHRDAVDQALARAIEYAETQLNDRLIGGIPIDLRNQAIATAARYAADAIPDALRHFNVTPERLNEMVEARIGWSLIDPNVERGDEGRAGRLRAAAA